VAGDAAGVGKAMELRRVDGMQIEVGDDPREERLQTLNARERLRATSRGVDEPLHANVQGAEIVARSHMSSRALRFRSERVKNRLNAAIAVELITPEAFQRVAGGERESAKPPVA